LNPLDKCASIRVVDRAILFYNKSAMRKRKSIKFYKELLPKRLTVEIHRTKEGEFWAKVKELPHCYTQAKSFWQLIEMVNDAVYTYLGIPTRLRKNLGYYMPKEILQKLRNEIVQKHWQRIVEEIISKEWLKRKSAVFKLYEKAAR